MLEYTDVAAIFAALLTLTMLLPKVRKGILTLWRKFRYNKNDALLKDIQAELKPNGGKSLRDVIDLIKFDTSRNAAFNKTQLNAHAKPLFELDQGGNLIWANRPFLRLTGYQLFELKGKGWYSTIDPEDKERARNVWAKALMEQTELEEAFLFKNTSGEGFPVHVRSYIIRDNESFFGYLCELTADEL